MRPRARSRDGYRDRGKQARVEPERRHRRRQPQRTGQVGRHLMSRQPGHPGKPPQAQRERVQYRQAVAGRRPGRQQRAGRFLRHRGTDALVAFHLDGQGENPRYRLGIADGFARGSGGLYEPAIHLSIAKDMEKVPGGDPAEFVRAHIRRLEALRRAGIVERLNENAWDIPRDYLDHAQAYDTRRNPQLGVRVLSAIDLDAQVIANGATWLDRELVAREPTPTRDSGFGRDAQKALIRRQHWLIEQGLARQDGDSIAYRANLLSTLARRELADKGHELAREHGGNFHIAENGERITGRYKGAVELVSGKYAMVETWSKEFTLVPWRPVIEKELGRTVSGIVIGDGVRWDLGRSRGLSIGM